jgi:hypothetical protein
MKYRFSADLYIIVPSHLFLNRQLIETYIREAIEYRPWRSLDVNGAGVPDNYLSFEKTRKSPANDSTHEFKLQVILQLNAHRQIEAYIRYCESLGKRIAMKLPRYEDVGVRILPNFRVERAATYSSFLA